MLGDDEAYKIILNNLYLKRQAYEMQKFHLDFIPTPLNLGLMQILTLHGSTLQALNLITFSVS